VNDRHAYRVGRGVVQAEAACLGGNLQREGATENGTKVLVELGRILAKRRVIVWTDALLR
jgi:hypothetical protein